MFRYQLNSSKKDKLLLVFNDMAKIGLDDKFAFYKQIAETFTDFDILFVKDIKEKHWYLTILDKIIELVESINNENKYSAVFGLTSSSGTIPLLNVFHSLTNFKKGVVVNGQPILDEQIVSSYKNECSDCAIFDKSLIKENYNNKYLEPWKNLLNRPDTIFQFYYNQSVSDKVYYNFIKSKNLPNVSIFYNSDENNNGHGAYIEELFYNKEFLNKVKNFFISN